MSRRRYPLLWINAILLAALLAISLYPQPWRWQEPAMSPVAVSEPALDRLQRQLVESDVTPFLQRPLFWNERRPPPPEAVVDEEVVQDTPARPLQELRVLGLFQSNQGRSGVILSDRQKTYRIAVGDHVHGWTLVGMDGQRAYFEQRGRPRQSVPLYYLNNSSGRR